MNTLLHFLLAYFVVQIVLGNAFEYIIPIFIFSVILDIDHVRYVLREKGKIKEKRFGYESRTRFHELYGFTIASVLISISFMFDQMLAQIIGISIILHYAMDFIVGKSRPFYPFSKLDVDIKLCSDRIREVSEVLLTVILLVFVWLTVPSLVL